MRLSTWTAVSAFLAGAIVASPRLGFADIMYVDAGAPPGGDGASWETAFVHLQDALNVATNGAQIWVAEGAYTPDQGGGQTAGDRDATFQLRNQIALYGGFAGNEITLEQRDVGTHHTVLSGDLAADDALVACVEDADCTALGGRCVDDTCIRRAHKEENSRRIITGSGTDASAVLDGFTVKGAHARIAGPTDIGGGLYSDSGSPTVRQCVFNDNSGDYGAGICNVNGSAPTVADCTFIENSSIWGSGIFNNYSNPAVTDCRFVRNVGGSVGGGMYNYYSSPDVSRCTFVDNFSVTSGGGVVSVHGAPTFTHCAFLGNQSLGHGGGMRSSFADTTLIGCLFSGNTAEYGGGLYDAAPVASGDGTLMVNCTFFGNTATERGGGIYVASWPILINCVVWANGPWQMYISGGEPVLDYSIIQGGWTGAGGVGVIATDPQFVDPDGPDDILGTADDDLRLTAGSPAIDAGSNGAVPLGITTDLDDLARFADDVGTPDTGKGLAPLVDLGAYEFQRTTGDMDGDGDVDLPDYAVFAECLAGPQLTPRPGACTPQEFESADLNRDGYVDVSDFAILQRAFR